MPKRQIYTENTNEIWNIINMYIDIGKLKDLNLLGFSLFYWFIHNFDIFYIS